MNVPIDEVRPRRLLIPCASRRWRLGRAGRGCFLFDFEPLRPRRTQVQKRDPKGLYAKVAAGEIKSFTGMSADAPYEAPLAS